LRVERVDVDQERAAAGDEKTYAVGVGASRGDQRRSRR
jgi:hypothetical protein